MTTKQTASELYAERCEDIARVLDWIELELDKHQTAAEASPGDWSDAGDLGHVLEKLIQTLAFLSNREAETIENLLGECR
jgi:uncharacterized alpha-E superfamily protein